MSAAPPSEHDREALARYLLSFRWPFRNEAVARQLVETGLPLWQQILQFVPQPSSRGTALELGSPPFHITLLFQRFRDYDLSLTGFAADGRPELVQEVESPEFGESFTFRCRCFDVERDRFPYADDSFDLVTWCEVIEHLTENPVHALAEIHRVLRPGGALVVSTPNASRADNIANLAMGRNIYDPYHLGAPLAGSRHSREYTLAELRDLLEGCRFRIERAADVDIYPPLGRNRRLLRFVMNRFVARFTGRHYRFHLFVRARKTGEPFRWHFPQSLFDYGHLGFHVAPRDARVTMGDNEQVHMAVGWSDLAKGPGGLPMRRSSDVGDLYVVAGPSPELVKVTLANGRGEAQAWQGTGDDLELLGTSKFEAAAGSWLEVVVMLPGVYRPGLPIHVRLDVPGGVDVHAVEVQ
jgi:SAM-dependent methyltransferase